MKAFNHYSAGIMFTLLATMGNANIEASAADNRVAALSGVHASQSEAVEKSRPQKNISLRVGETSAFRVEGAIKQVVMGKSGLVIAQSNDNQILLSGQIPGETNLHVWTTTALYVYKLTVSGEVSPAANYSTASSMPTAPVAQVSRAVIQEQPESRAQAHYAAQPEKTSFQAVSDEVAATEKMTLYKGQIRSLPVEGKIKRIAVGNSALLTTTAVDNQVLLIGEDTGDTSLYIWTATNHYRYKVTVVQSDPADLERQLQTILRRSPEIAVERSGGRLILTGVTHTDNLSIVSNAVKNMAGVVNLLKADEGQPLKKTVMFKVQLVEVSKNVLQEIGVQWDKSLHGPQGAVQGVLGKGGVYGTLPQGQPDFSKLPNTPFSVGGAINGAFVGITSAITSKINFAINSGDAYVLAAPELSSKSGGKASFLAGGEVPIVKAGAFGTTDVEYKKYGILLNISPVIDANNNISARIETEMSQIDASSSYGGFPGFLTRRTESDVSLAAGQTIALSGLMSANSSNAVDKVPFLGDLPVLGRLFRSESFRKNKSDLVIFVSPVVMDPEADKNIRMLELAAQIQRDQKALEVAKEIPPLKIINN